MKFRRFTSDDFIYLYIFKIILLKNEKFEKLRFFHLQEISFLKMLLTFGA